LQPEFPAPCRRIEDGAGSERPGQLTGGEGVGHWRIDCGAQGLRGPLEMRGLAGTRVEVIVNVAWQDGSSTTGVLHSGAPGRASEQPGAVGARRVGDVRSPRRGAYSVWLRPSAVCLRLALTGGHVGHAREDD